LSRSNFNLSKDVLKIDMEVSRKPTLNSFTFSKYLVCLFGHPVQVIKI